MLLPTVFGLALCIVSQLRLCRVCASMSTMLSHRSVMSKISAWFCFVALRCMSGRYIFSICCLTLDVTLDAMLCLTCITLPQPGATDEERYALDQRETDAKGLDKNCARFHAILQK